MQAIIMILEIPWLKSRIIYIYIYPNENVTGTHELRFDP